MVPSIIASRPGPEAAKSAKQLSDDDIEAYSDSVMCLIRKCIEDNNPHLPQPKNVD